MGAAFSFKTIFSPGNHDAAELAAGSSPVYWIEHSKSVSRPRRWRCGLVSVEGSAEVILVQGNSESITIQVPARQRGEVRADMADGLLRIRNARSRRWWSSIFGGSRRTPQITVEFRQLRSIALSGAVKLRSDRLRATQLAIEISGAGTLKLADIEIDALRISGSGAVQVSLSGAGTVE